MKTFRRICAVNAFTLLLATTTFAGDIQTGAPSSPPPDGSSVMTPGDIATGEALQTPQATSDPVVDTALNLLQTLLSVF